MNSNEESQPLLRTIHGSYLYGLNHAGSDTDNYSVLPGLPRRYAHQTIQGEDDDFQASLSRFMEMCDDGVPQALEAMFSPYAIIDPAYQAFFRNYRIGATATAMRYRRTVLNFANADHLDDNARYKRRRHALRLCINLSEAMSYGRFNPRLSDQDQARITELASFHNSNYEETMQDFLGAALLGELA